MSCSIKCARVLSAEGGDRASVAACLLLLISLQCLLLLIGLLYFQFGASVEVSSTFSQLLKDLMIPPDLFSSVDCYVCLASNNKT